LTVTIFFYYIVLGNNLKKENMITLFYLFGVLAIMWELHSLTNIRKVHKTAISMNERMKSGTYKKEDFTSNENTLLVLMSLYFVWAIVGLFTFNWVAFLVLLGLSLIPKKYVAIRFLDALLSLLVLLFIVINHYHLKINLLDLIISLF
jgi:hypothetical protein